MDVVITSVEAVDVALNVDSKLYKQFVVIPDLPADEELSLVELLEVIVEVAVVLLGSTGVPDIN